MRARAGILEVSTDPVPAGRWCTLRIGGAATFVAPGADVSLLFVEAWRRWIEARPR